MHFFCLAGQAIDEHSDNLDNLDIEYFVANHVFIKIKCYSDLLLLFNAHNNIN
jgi:hypothetical protein